MKQKIHLKNYRAFPDTQLLISPMNFLMGTNGSGKTSILQFFMLLNQSNGSADDVKSAIKLNGELCSFGTIENLFFLKDTNSDIEISFEVSDADTEKVFVDILDDANEALSRTIERFAYFIAYSRRLFKNNALGDLTEEIENIWTSLNFLNSSERKQRDIQSLIKEFKSKKEAYLELKDLYQKHEKLIPRIEQSSILKNLPISKNYRTYKRNILDIEAVLTSPDLDQVENLINFINNNRHSVYMTYLFKSKKDNKDGLRIELVKIDFKSRNKKIVSFCQIGDDAYKIEGNFSQTSFLQHFKSTREELFNAKACIFNNFSKLRNDKLTATLSHKWFHSLEETLRKQFQQRPVVAIKPLRGFPRRYYDAYSSEFRDDSFDILEMLKGDGQVKDFINNWVRRFDIELDAEEYEQFLGKIYTKRQINGKDLSIDLIDSGFGFSQVLPVLYRGASAPSNSIFLVEQPEIHLHPKMQAELADFFIDLHSFKNRNSNSNFTMIIETHSEYLIKRMSRRIGEKKFESFNHLSTAPKSNEVSLWFTEKNSLGGSSVRVVEFDEYGEIEWPEDFFEARNEDLKARMRNKMRKLKYER